MAIRKVLVTFVGHIDHGKSSLLDRIRGTTIIETEAGKITQAIGASDIPIQTVKKICGNLLEQLKLKITIPGFLAIDTPGHAAFSNLRKRGGALADIAVLVVDINEGVMPQTEEVLKILTANKTPFIVAANKIDLFTGWQKKEGSLLQEINTQSEDVKKKLDNAIYELVGKLSEKGFNSERFDRVEDFTKQIGIVPVSAETGEGIPELLMMLTGLAQRYLEKKLKIDVKGAGKGTILEVKETKGLGTTVDVIVYDGSIKRNDIIVIGGIEEPIVTKVRALLVPKELCEMRDIKTNFNQVQEINAAAGIRIAAPELEKAVAGMPLRVAKKGEEKAVKEEIQKEVSEILVETDKEGVIVKADTLGSVEAVVHLLKEAKTPVRKAAIGNVNKKDTADAKSEESPLFRVILGFNVKDESEEKGVKVITSNIIYNLIENMQKWQEAEKKKIETEKLESLVRPFKIQILRGYVFRQSNPAVVGVSVLEGTLRADSPVMKTDGASLTTVKEIQSEQETVEKAEKDKQVAVSLPGLTVGRQINEDDILYSDVPEEDFKKLKKLKEYLSKEERGLLKEIAAIKRKKNVVWGI